VIVVGADGAEWKFPAAIDLKVSEGFLFLFDGHSSTRAIAIFVADSWLAVYKQGAKA
jgi:hypothetical protein